MDSSTQKLKDMIQRMTELDGATEKQRRQLDEMASMNVSMSGETADEVASLMRMMQNAGMNDAAPVTQDTMPVRQDMERLAGIMGDPEPEGMEEPDTVVGDTPMSAPSADIEGDDTASKEQLGDIRKLSGLQSEESLEEWSSSDADTLKMLHGLVQSAANGDRRAGAQFEDYIDNNFPHVNSEELIAKLVKMDDNQQFEVLHDMMTSEYQNDSDDDYTDQSMRKGEMGTEAYDNSPEEEYQDAEYMTKDISGGLNRRKKSYKDAEDGDNPMAVENIRDRLYAKLSEKKAKPDFADIDGDGDTKEPMKKAAKDKKKKEEK